MIKAVYANLGVLSDPERWNRLIEIADTTEINAIVIDVKQDTIYYDTQVPFFRDIDGMVTPIFDPRSCWPSWMRMASTRSRGWWCSKIRSSPRVGPIWRCATKSPVVSGAT